MTGEKIESPRGADLLDLVLPLLALLLAGRLREGLQRAAGVIEHP